MAVDGLPPLRDIIRENGLNARKSLGQNFLLDLNLTAKIARQVPDLPQSTIVEVGPGPGGLTRALLAGGAKRVIAIERDERCAPVLEQIAAHYPGRLVVRLDDAMTTSWIDLLADHVDDEPARIVANLPYNIATPLLTGWLETNPWPPWWASMTLMFQREVADRIVAGPGTKTYGRLSVLAGLKAKSQRMFDLPPSAFTPPPKVTSSVVELLPVPQKPSCDPIWFSRVTTAAFGQRRKMLRASLRQISKTAETAILEAGLKPTERAEQIPVEGFVALANAFAAHAASNPTQSGIHPDENGKPSH